MRYFLIVLLFYSLSFGITLDEVIETAKKENPSLKQKVQDLKISKLQLKEDKNLFYPEIFLNYSYTIFKDTPYTNLPPSSSFPAAISFKQMNKEFYMFEAGLNLPIFTGLSRFEKLKISKKEIRFNKLSYKEKENEILNEVKKSYIDILQAQAVLETYRQQLKSVKSHLVKTEEFYKEGLTTKVDILQSKVRLSQVEMKIKKAEGELKVLKSKLSALLNNKIKEDFNVEEVNYKIPENLNVNELIQKALKNRKILKAFKIKISEFESLKNINRSDFLPKIYAQGKYIYSDQYPYLDPKGNIALSIFLNIQFQGLKPYYSMLKTKQMKRKISYQLKELKNFISLEVRSAYERFNVAKENLKVAENSLSEAKEYYRMVVEQFNNQLASTTDVLDAESYLTTAKKGVIISKYELIKTLFDLEKAVGGKIEE
ncbi:TolC family protein [Persephonella sp.]